MPHPPSKILRRRFKRTGGNLAAALSIPEPLYLAALSVAEREHDNNFSGYVRALIRADLRTSEEVSK